MFFLFKVVIIKKVEIFRFKMIAYEYYVSNYNNFKGYDKVLWLTLLVTPKL